MSEFNELSFCMEPFEFLEYWENEDDKKTQYIAFYYVVDGKKLDFGEEYYPATEYEILTRENDYIDENYPMVILNRCSCTLWECDSYVAKVIEKPGKIEWFVHQLRDAAQEAPTYVFDRTQYEKVMYDIWGGGKKTAWKWLYLILERWRYFSMLLFQT